jgi:hypothetical protein
MDKKLEKIIDDLVDQGFNELEKHRENHLTAIKDALIRATLQPGSEVRLYYKNPKQAIAAWLFATKMADRCQVLDRKSSSIFNIELGNGSGIMFWLDPEAKDSTD